MAVLIEIPEELTRYADGATEVTVTGQTVEAALAALFARFPALQSRVTSERGDFHPWIPVFLNGRKVLAQCASETPVADGDRIEIAVLASGG